MNREAELEFRLRIERKNYKVAARRYRSHLRQERAYSSEEYRKHMLETQNRINAILEELATLEEEEKPKANDYLRPRHDVW